MKIENIFPLDGSVEASQDRFGNKIHLISKLSRKGVPIPKGFYFAADHRGGLLSTMLDDDSRSLLNIHFQDLIRNARSGKCIVRTSSSVEDNPEHQFSGLFETYKNITSFDNLLDAIKACMASRVSDKVKNYSSNFGINVNQIRVAVLVQEQVVSSISGLAHLDYSSSSRSFLRFDYMEIIPGEMEELISGAVSPFVFEVHTTAKNRPTLVPKGNFTGFDYSILNAHLSEIADCFHTIKDCLKQSVLVEFCLEKDNGVAVFQARPYKVISSHDPIRSHQEMVLQASPVIPKRMIFRNEDKWGLKGAAMVAFKELGLFHAPLVWFEPGTRLYEMRNSLEQLPESKDGWTIRYSQGDEIGLPRLFVKSIEEAYERIAETYKNEFFTIVHAYLRVARSYELIIDKDYLVLEHIPGLWESNNTLEPDVMILDGRKATLLKVKNSRQKLVVGPAFAKHIIEVPQDDKFFTSRISKLVHITHSILLPTLGENLPLNCHFVETEDEEFNFLNIRRIARVNRKYVRGGSFFHVRRLEDLAGWDNKTPILLRLTTQRGKEKELIELANYLPKGSFEVYVTFGYLSHPAILLREFGVNVVPAYFDREIKEITL